MHAYIIHACINNHVFTFWHTRANPFENLWGWQPFTTFAAACAHTFTYWDKGT